MEDEIQIEIELPGFRKEEIMVQATKDGVEIRAQNKSKYELKKKNVYKYESNYSGYYKKFSIPKEADYENIKTEYENNILRITIPKLKTQKKKLIKIQ